MFIHRISQDKKILTYYISIMLVNIYIIISVSYKIMWVVIIIRLRYCVREI